MNSLKNDFKQLFGWFFVHLRSKKTKLSGKAAHPEAPGGAGFGQRISGAA